MCGKYILINIVKICYVAVTSKDGGAGRREIRCEISEYAHKNLKVDLGIIESAVNDL